MCKRMRKSIRKIIAKGLVLAMLFNFATPDTVDACDTAVMEVAQEVSAACPYLAPIVIAGAIVITGATTVIGIKKANEKPQLVYQTLGHLPDCWKPHSVIEKIKHNGKIVQRRFYGEDGRPLFDVDLTNHGTPQYHPFEHDGAHIHEWNHNLPKKKRRLPGREMSETEYNRYIKNFDRSNKRVERMRLDKDGK